MNEKTPLLKLTVGAAYLAFNTPSATGAFDPTTFKPTIKSEVIKSIGTTENAESTVVRASGKDYSTVNLQSGVELAMEVVAFDPETISIARGEHQNENGLIQSGRVADRPYLALGFPIKKLDGGLRYVWYPKCQLVENTDDIATSEASFSEQNDTLSFRAYAYNDVGDIKCYVDSEIKAFPAHLTEDAFFAKPIINEEDLDALLTTGDGA